MLGTKASKTHPQQPVTIYVLSWNDVPTIDGDSLVSACNAIPKCEVTMERSYENGDTKAIKMCPPGIKAFNNSLHFHNNVIMTKDDSELFYFFTGDVLLNGMGEACDDNSDCADGLYCNRRFCEMLDEGACIFEREDRDCLLLNDPLRTKCYQTEAKFGALCGCDNDPFNNPCISTTHTCDFPCELPDAIPTCESPESRNKFCEEWTNVTGSECLACEGSSPLCTIP